MDGESQPEQFRVCIGCRNAFPLNATHFHRAKDNTFHPRCRACRNKQNKNNRKKKRDHKLDEIEKGAVDLFIASARVGGSNIPHSSELVEVLMEYFGGVRGFANLYVKQFFDAPVGGAFRTKMLETVARLVQANTGMGGAKKPLDLMTEEELESELRRQVLEAAVNLQKSIPATKVERLDAPSAQDPTTDPAQG